MGVEGFKKRNFTKTTVNSIKHFRRYNSAPHLNGISDGHQFKLDFTYKKHKCLNINFGISGEL